MYRSMLVAALLLAACSDSNGDNGPSAGVDNSNAVDAATASADETEQAVDAIAGTTAALSPAGLRASDLRALAIPLRPLCATVSSDIDSDGDGTLDNATYTYALPACALASFRGGDLELTGGIRVSDPDPSPGYAYRLEYQDFKWHMTMPDTTQSFATTRNGVRSLALENGTLVLTSTLTMQRGFGTRGDASVGSEVRSVFSTTNPLTFGLPMPTGEISQSGTVTMFRQGLSERYDVRTVTPLAIDANCAAYPRISAGEVHYVLPDSSYVKVAWPGCGLRPTIEFVGP